mmetsp:Transcript_84312/g.165028  ORF Transcript_84312/g.165028 Transcript_84312/m.165028 type:complete len:275 (-) Transcript_84312:129-953(-)
MVEEAALAERLQCGRRAGARAGRAEHRAEPGGHGLKEEQEALLDLLAVELLADEDDLDRALLVIAPVGPVRHLGDVRHGVEDELRALAGCGDHALRAVQLPLLFGQGGDDADPARESQGVHLHILPHDAEAADLVVVSAVVVGMPMPPTMAVILGALVATVAMAMPLAVAGALIAAIMPMAMAVALMTVPVAMARALLDGDLLHVEGAQVREFRRRHNALHGGHNWHCGVVGTDALEDLRNLVLVDEVELIEQNLVGEGDLAVTFLIVLAPLAL